MIFLRIQGPRDPRRRPQGCPLYPPKVVSFFSHRLSALANHTRVARIYEHESYDYPTQIQETISGITSHVGYNITSFAAHNLKNTNLPSPTLPAPPPPPQHKTLPHALTRAASAAHATIANAPDGSASKFGQALALFAQGWDKVATARVDHDIAIQDRFVQPWQLTLNANVSVAIKARNAVKVSRLDLDAAKQASVLAHSLGSSTNSFLSLSSLKNANPARQEQARLDVENAEDDLVQKTEIAIQLMKAVLDNVIHPFCLFRVADVGQA